MKETTACHIFQHPWDTVVQAVWRKYPNPVSESVIGTDIVDREINKQGILQTHRLMKTQWFVPVVGRALIGDQKVAYGSEHSECDPKNKTLTVISKNITYSSLVTIAETLTYSPGPEGQNQTHLNHCTKVTVNNRMPLASYWEKLVTNIVESNTSKGREAIEWVIDNIKKEAEEALSCVDEVLTNIHPKTL
ncbi:PRELI domain containing protein 3A-like [Mizuhopecten yessoensis]|uniref:PRELI domain containing protein 3A-like n=1 Tax=Mizuhopecten yessoensis TaxID=6573 RepID=UPI000B4576FB|nr:PRELI domain containing protein 3A-like [Mizuhopecten yessoensis]